MNTKRLTPVLAAVMLLVVTGCSPSQEPAPEPTPSQEPTVIITPQPGTETETETPGEDEHAGTDEHGHDPAEDDNHAVLGGDPDAMPSEADRAAGEAIAGQFWQAFNTVDAASPLGSNQVPVAVTAFTTPEFQAHVQASFDDYGQSIDWQEWVTEGRVQAAQMREAYWDTSSPFDTGSFVVLIDGATALGQRAVEEEPSRVSTVTVVRTDAGWKVSAFSGIG